MGRYASNKGGDFQSAPVGTHVARCFKIVDIGTQHGEYQGKANARNQVIIFWELPNELMDDGNPFTVSKFYTNSLNEKATLRHDLEQWRGRAFTKEEEERFDLMNILGKACMLSLIAKPDSKGTKVGGVMSIPKGTTVPPQVNPSFTFWIEEWDQEKFDSMTDGLKDLIKKSDEYKDLIEGGGHEVPMEAEQNSDLEEAPF